MSPLAKGREEFKAFDVQITLKTLFISAPVALSALQKTIFRYIKKINHTASHKLRSVRSWVPASAFPHRKLEARNTICKNTLPLACPVNRKQMQNPRV